MSVTVSQLVQKIVVQGDTEAKSKLSGMKQAAEETSGGFKSMLGSALSFAGGQAIFNLVGQAVGFLKDQIKDTIDVTIKHADVMKQTNDVITSTGGAAGMTAKSINDLAESLSKSKIYTADATQEGENLLLTFTNIGKTVMPQATSVMLDLSKAMGQDVKSSAIQMGKALNDPEKGITALTRVGVTFTQQQKDQIKAMQDSGNMAGAQKIILAELSKEFGGSADAGKSFGGQMDLLKNRMEDFKIKIGTAVMPILQQFLGTIVSNVLPALDRFATWFTSTGLPAIQKFAGTVSSVVGPAFTNAANFIAKFTGNANALIPVLQILGVIIASVLVPAMGALAIETIIATWPVLLIVAAIAALTAVFLHFYNTNAQFKGFIDGLIVGFQQAWQMISTNFIPVMQKIGQVIMTQVWPVLVNIGTFLASIFLPVWKELVTMWQTQLLPAFTDMAPVLQPLGMLLGAIGMIIGTVVVVALGLLVGVLKGVVTAFAAFLSGVIQAFGGAVQFIMGFVQIISGIMALIVDIITGNWSNIAGDLETIGGGILTMISGFCNVFMGLIGGLCLAVAGFFWGLVTGVIDFFRYLFDKLVGHSIVIDLVNGILSWIGKIGPGIMAAISSIPGMFMNVWNTAITDATNAGSNIVKGIADGITAGLHWISGAITNVTQFISDHLPHSPAKIGPLMHLAEQGTSIVDQVSNGLLAGMPKLNTAMVALTKPISMSLTPGAMSNGVSLAPIGVSNQQPIIIHNYIDGKQITNNVGPRLIKSGRTGGPLRANL